jgi:hypothetical protein
MAELPMEGRLASLTGWATVSCRRLRQRHIHPAALPWSSFPRMKTPLCVMLGLRRWRQLGRGARAPRISWRGRWPENRGSRLPPTRIEWTSPLGIVSCVAEAARGEGDGARVCRRHLPGRSISGRTAWASSSHMRGRRSRRSGSRERQHPGRCQLAWPRHKESVRLGAAS